MTRRTESARQALDQYCLSKDEPMDTLETGIIDLLTDLLHLARLEGLDSCTAAPALDGSSCQFRHIRLRLAFFPLAPGKIRHEPRLEPLKAGKTLF